MAQASASAPAATVAHFAFARPNVQFFLPAVNPDQPHWSNRNKVVVSVNDAKLIEGLRYACRNENGYPGVNSEIKEIGTLPSDEAVSMAEAIGDEGSQIPSNFRALFVKLKTKNA